ncbi:MAG TPA: NFACT RNA binding domain-containing protein [Candidatus Nanoarchaeia archaeon]|nr:NFACT RNA binding domain-containing protein [Candidatus Nanoarchaeia archaeon]
MGNTGSTSKKFRQFLTSSGKPVVAGKNAEQNEKVVEQAGKGEIVLHTKAAGSPFVNIKAAGAGVSKMDIREAAVFCARHSRDWKNSKSDVKMHVFKGSSIYKDKGMKTGTFGVKKFKEITIKKEEIKMFEESLK